MTAPASRHVVAQPGEPSRRLRIRRRTWRRIRRWGFIAAAGLIGILVIVSFALSSFPAGFSGGGGRTSAIEGVGSAVAHMPTANHLTDPGETVSYSTVPATSGNHWFTPSECGIYDEELSDERVVHNMEHGHVIISYNLPDDEEVSRMIQLAEELPSLNRLGIVRPYSKIDEGTVAVTAWGVIDQFQGVDEEGIRDFYDAYSGNRFSPEAARVGAIPCVSSR